MLEKFLIDFGISEKNIPKIINNNLLSFHNEDKLIKIIEDTFIYYQSLGITKDDFIKMMVRTPSLCCIPVESTKEKIIFLQNYGYSLTDISTMLKRFNLMSSVNSIETKINYLISLGLTKEEIIKITIKSPQVLSLTTEAIKEKLDFFHSLGFKKEEILKIIKQFPTIFDLSRKNIEERINEFISFGYSKEDVLKIILKFPAINGFSKETIRKKQEFLISLGYTKEEVINMTIKLPSLLALKSNSIKEKIDFYKSINLDFWITKNSINLMQSINLSYARYMFLLNRGIVLNENNYMRLFYNATMFKNIYGVSKEDLLNMYPYVSKERSVK